LRQQGKKIFYLADALLLDPGFRRDDDSEMIKPKD
jgi:hypothetical protein